MRIATFFLLASVGTVSGVAQQPHDTARPAYDGSDSPNAPRRIYIDQDCRVLPDTAHLTPGKKAEPFSDPIICHLESVNNSNHIEEKIVGQDLQRSRVYIYEQEYVLQNITEGQVVFVVQQAVNADWTVDSDPQPVSTENNLAVFPVYADPGQIVRLHVGLRHTRPLKTQYIGMNRAAPAAQPGN
jgi:hypothetical protein